MYEMRVRNRKGNVWVSETPLKAFVFLHIQCLNFPHVHIILKLKSEMFPLISNMLCLVFLTL